MEPSNTSPPKPVGSGRAGLLSGSAFIFTCRLSGAILTFATQALLARWMGAEALGIYVLAFSWLLLLATATGLGYPTVVMRFIGQYAAHADTARIHGLIKHSRLIVLAISATLAGTAILLILLCKGTLIPTNHANTLIIALFCVPVYALFNLHDRIAHAHSWFAMAILPTMVLRPLLFFLIIYAASGLADKIPAETAMGLHFMVFVVVSAGQFIFLYDKLKRTHRRTPAHYQTRLWLHTAVPLLVISLITQYTADISIIIAGFFLQPAEIAIYSVSFRIALLIGFAIFAVHAMVIPRISRLHAKNNRDEMQHLILHATQLTFAGSLASLLLLFYFGKSMLALFGDEFTAGFESLMILACAQLVIAMTGPVNALLSMTGLQQHYLRIVIWALMALVLLSVFFIPYYGVNGAALSVLLVTIFWSLWAHTLVSRHLNVDSSILAFRSR